MPVASSTARLAAIRPSNASIHGCARSFAVLGFFDVPALDMLLMMLAPTVNGMKLLAGAVLTLCGFQ